jgi:hypothetical protein
MVKAKPVGRALALALALGVAGVSGCATEGALPPPVPVTVDVPVPEPVYCAAQIPARPSLAISTLSESSSPADTIRAYAASVVILKGAVEELDKILAGCTRPGARRPAPEASADGRFVARAASSQ